MAQINFNPGQHEKEKPIEELPAGLYLAAIVNSELRDTADGFGKYLKVEWQVIDPSSPFRGRKIWDNLNLINNNVEAMKIANSRLALICDLCGFSTVVQDSVQLHNKPMLIKVSRSKDKQGNERSKISTIQAATGVSPQNAMVNPTSSTAPPINNGTPWANG